MEGFQLAVPHKCQEMLEKIEYFHVSSKQNGHHFANHIFKSISWMKTAVFGFKFHLICSPRVQYHPLTHWGRVTHICVGNLTIIGWDNGLSPGRRQAIIWTNAGILLIGPLGKKKLQWTFNQKYNIFFPENTFESVVWKTAVFLSRPQCVKNTYNLWWSSMESTIEEFHKCGRA